MPEQKPGNLFKHKADNTVNRMTVFTLQRIAFFSTQQLGKLSVSSRAPGYLNGKPSPLGQGIRPDFSTLTESFASGIPHCPEGRRHCLDILICFDMIFIVR